MIAMLFNTIVTVAQCACIVILYHVRVTGHSEVLQSDAVVFGMPTVMGFVGNVLINWFRPKDGGGPRWSIVQSIGTAFGLTSVAFAIALIVVLNMSGG